MIEEGLQALREGKPRLLSYGVADEIAWQVGLACGGTIQVFVEPDWALNGIYASLKNNLEARSPMAVVTVLNGPPEALNRKLIVYPDGHTEGDLAIHDETSVPKVLALLAQETGGVVELEDETSLFIQVYSLPPRLIIVGAVHFADPLVTIANAVGFDTILIDPRKAYASRERYPHAKEILVEWPQEALQELKLQAVSNEPSQVVRVSGRVRVPGEYPLESGMTVSDLIRAGGGLSEEAYGGEADLARYEVRDGQSRKTDVVKIDLDRALSGELSADVELAPFDFLVVKEISQWTAQETVRLEGQVRFPGEYPIERGETLRSVIDRAGGLTPLAFPQGSAFTRESLKERERRQVEWRLPLRP